MAEKTFRTRIKLRYHDYTSWITNDPVLFTGELAITAMPLKTGQESPDVLLKIGDGIHKYSELPFLSAQAGDVYEWAKQENKPTYNASEIEGLEDYISGQVGDTNTKYRIVEGTEPQTYILQSQELGSTEWTDASTITVPDGITYTISSDENGKVTFTPSKGDVQEITVVEITDTKEGIVTGSTKVPTAGAVADYVAEHASEAIVFQSPYDKDTNKAATMQDVDQATARLLRLKGSVDKVGDLPTSDNKEGDTYHVKSTKAEYTWIIDTDDEGNETGRWEKLGDLVDMSEYYTKTEVDDSLDLKQDLITPTNKLNVDLVDGLATPTRNGLMSSMDKSKLDGIDSGAQENKIEKVVAGDALVPIIDKTVTLAKIAETGNVNDLIQSDGDIIILEGGNSLGFPEPSTLILNGGTSNQGV